MRQNDEIDGWVKTATALPLPPREPTYPSAVVMCSEVAHLLAKNAAVWGDKPLQPQLELEGVRS